MLSISLACQSNKNSSQVLFNTAIPAVFVHLKITVALALNIKTITKSKDNVLHFSRARLRQHIKPDSSHNPSVNLHCLQQSKARESSTFPSILYFHISARARRRMLGHRLICAAQGKSDKNLPKSTYTWISASFSSKISLFLTCLLLTCQFF